MGIMSSASLNICHEPFLFFRCSTNGFVGCCTVNPCDMSWCPNFPEPIDKPWLADSNTAVSPSSSIIEAISRIVPSTAPAIVPAFLSESVQHFSGNPSKTEQPAASTTTSSSATIPSSVLGTAPLSEDVVIVWATSQVYVTPEAFTLSTEVSATSPTTMAVTTTTFSSLLAKTQIYTNSPSTAATTSLASSSSALSEPQAQPPTESSNKDTIIATVIGVFGGLAVASLFIWLLRRWNRKRKVEKLRAGQLDDDPSMAGKDANRAGDYFSKDEGTLQR